MEDTKVIVIGLDGADYRIIDPLIKKGRLPNLKRLIEQGAKYVLESTVPPITPIAWTSAITGKNAGKHGIFDFTKPPLHTYHPELISSNQRDAEAVWEILNREGYRTGILNIPYVTYPPEPVNGFMVAGIGTPSLKGVYTYPPELSEELRKRGYKISLEDKTRENRDLRIKEEKRLLRIQLDTMIYLMKKYPWDFLFTVFTITDSVPHIFWDCVDPNHPKYSQEKSDKYGKIFERIYTDVDAAIGKILEQVDLSNTYVIIMSDHGSCPLYKEFLVNNWLKKEGYLRLKEERLIKRAIKTVLMKLGFSKETLLKIAIQIGKEKWAYSLPSIVKKSVPSHEVRNWDIDWNKTKAWAHGCWGRIYLNLKNRQPNGKINEKDYHKLIKEITEKLYKITDPLTGKNLIKRVYTKDELYNGPHTENAADITIELENETIIPIETFRRGEIFSTPKKAGTHSKYGVLIITGPNIKKGVKPGTAKIIDILPTILYIFNIPLLTDFDGRPLKECFINQHPLRYITRKDFEKERIKKILRRMNTDGKRSCFTSKTSH